MKIQESMINSTAKLLRYQHGMAYYGLSVPYSEGLYSFPVPISELKDKILCVEEKTIFLFKHIRRAIQDGTLHKEKQQM